MLRRVLLIVSCALVLASCRLDVTVDVAIDPDGTGTVTVVAVADAELVGQVEGLADALVFDDAEAAGWVVDGPTSTPSGGLEVTLTHEVSSPQELANVLNSLGPPFTEMLAGRTTVDDQTTNAIEGTLVLSDGFESFADADLLAAVGGLPFEDELTAAGATPAESMSFTFRASLPGELVSTTGEVAAATDGEVEGSVVTWEAPLDGTTAEVAIETVQRPADDDSWADTVATVAFVALIVWLVIATVFVVAVLVGRRRRARRRRARRGSVRAGGS